MSQKCSNCVFAILLDHGYSNWTVVGTDLYCSKNLNPGCPFDLWFGHDERVKFAESCKEFIDGKPVCIDVDREEVSDPFDCSPESAAKAYATEHVPAETLMKFLE